VNHRSTEQPFSGEYIVQLPWPIGAIPNLVSHATTSSEVNYAISFCQLIIVTVSAFIYQHFWRFVESVRQSPI